MLTKQPRFAARYGLENFKSLYSRYEEAGKIARAHELLGKMVAHAEAQAQAGEYSLDDWFFMSFRTVTNNTFEFPSHNCQEIERSGLSSPNASRETQSPTDRAASARSSI